VWHFPRVLGNAFNLKYEDLPWENDPLKFELWCKGQTGFPIVDAGMRELVETGFMHNRVRMITASFLTKDLHIDWRWGERFFARHLADYDPAVNNGNWQWAASTGCDAQPYFRVFNPWSQQQKFDPDCVYIKRWLPELAALSAKEIHKLGSTRNPLASSYPRPMVDHGERAGAIKMIFKRAGRG
jgi:deoxyribodipyrimidine photo-lyase